MKTLRLYALFVFCLLCIPRLRAQRNNMWPTGYYTGLDFSGGGSVPAVISDHDYGGLINSSVSDRCGQLLFYSDGHSVYDRLHRPLPNGLLISAGSSSAIAAVPGSDSQYYLFTDQGFTSAWSAVTYSIVDMRLNGGYGDIALPYKNILLDSFRTASMVIAGSCGNQWLISHHRDSAIFYAYSLNSTSGPGRPVVSRVGRNSTLTMRFLHNELTVSPDFTKIVLCGMSLFDLPYARTGDNIALFDFDAVTGKVSNYQPIDTADVHKFYGGYAADFSPDGTKLYAGLGVDPGYLVQYDLSAGTLPAIKASATILAYTKWGIFSDLRRGPDDALYCINNKFSVPVPIPTCLSRVPFPDRAGTTCGYEPFLTPFGVGYPFMFTYLGNYFIEHLAPADTLYYCSVKKLCKGSYVTAHSSLPKGHYTWYDGDTAYEKKLYDTGTFWLWSSGSCGTIYETIQVVPAMPDTSFGLTTDTTICIGKTITLHTEKVWDSYKWSTGDTGLTTIAHIPDTVLLAASYQCHVVIDTFFIHSGTSDSSYSLVLDTTRCAGAQFIYPLPAGRILLQWSDGDTSTAKKITAPETLCRYSYKDCVVYTDTIRIKAINNVYHSSLRDTFFCTGAALKLESRSPADSILWSTGSSAKSIPVNTMGTYWVNTVKNCTHFSDTVQVHEHSYDEQVEHIDTVCCHVSSATLRAADGYDRYLWSTGGTGKSIVVSGPGLVAVRLTATDTSTCRIDNKLYQLDFTNFSNPMQDTILCRIGDTIRLDAGIGRTAHYQWNTGDTTAAIYIHDANTYIVNINAGGCILTDTVQVLYRPLFLSVGSDTSVCKGQSLTLQASVSQAQYLWSTGATDSFITINQDGHYSLRVVKDGCTSTAATDISFINCDHCIRFPNAFSPNNDGINDYFKPLLSCPPENYELSIYNRWGQQVWHTLSPADTWDGTFKGIPADGNTFFYMLRVSFTGQSATPQLFKGELILIR